jgi:hypothetical protein
LYTINLLDPERKNTGDEAEIYSYDIYFFCPISDEMCGVRTRTVAGKNIIEARNSLKSYDIPRCHHGSMITAFVGDYDS